MFEQPTVASLSAALGAKGAGQSVDVRPIHRARQPGDFRAPLSLQQEQLWPLVATADPPGLYNETVHFRISGLLDRVALYRALEFLADRHEALRTAIAVGDGGPHQVVAASAVLQPTWTDLGSLPPERRQRALDEAIADHNAQPFDPSVAPMALVGAIGLGDDGTEVVITLDHLIADGTSLYILASELIEVHRAFAACAAPRLRPLAIGYGAFAIWQREWLNDERLGAHRDYWRRKLHRVPLAQGVPFDKPQPALPWRTLRSFHLRISPRSYEALKHLTRTSGTSMFVVAVAAIQALVACTTGRRDIVVSAPMSGRSRPELDGVVGLFAGTARIRTNLGGSPRFAEILNRCGASVLEAIEHQDLAFAHMRGAVTADQELSGAGGDVGLGTHPRDLPVDVRFFRAASDVWRPGMNIVARPPGERSPQSFFVRGQRHPLAATLIDDGTRMWGRVTYKAEVYEDRTIERFTARLQSLLAIAVHYVDLTIDEMAGKFSS